MITMAVPAAARVTEPSASESEAPEAAAPVSDSTPDPLIREQSRDFLQRIAKVDDPEFLARIAKLERDVSTFASGGSEGLHEIIRREVSELVQELMPQQQPMSELEREFEALHQQATPTAAQPPPEELEELRLAIQRIELTLDDQGKELLGRVQRKAEITLVERMFEKLRGIIASIKDEINVLGSHVEKLVRRSEMEKYVETSLSSLLDEEQAAAANKPLKCLACGRSRLKASTAETFFVRPGELPPLSPAKTPK
jgi:hypothetical protein